MFLLCGLGNPGKKFINTRHNIGFKLADNIIDYFDFTKVKVGKTKEIYTGKINSHKILLLKPLTFMNLSGKSVSETINFYKLKSENVFVFHDDLDLKLAKIKIKKGGGNGGHNGLSSIDNYIGKEYFRIRIGIDHPGNKNQVSKYVLSNFLKGEQKIIKNKLNKITINFNLIFTDVPLFLTKIVEK
tara:strand:- start:2974 stop:3531 length:558 start_codon:yes stop_codon:yes gene_type:complete